MKKINIKSVLMIRKASVAILCCLFITSCDDFLDVGAPKNQLVRETVLASEKSATAALVGIYSRMMENLGLASILTTTCAGMSSDELTNYSTGSNEDQFAKNALVPSNTMVTQLWSDAYRFIYVANSIYEGIDEQSWSAEGKARIKGEVLFIRAFCHFYLVNLFGDVPLLTTSDYRTNALASRTDVEDVYAAIEADLLQAIELLPATYPTTDKSRPNRMAAQALLARVYLYTEQWADAEAQATAVITSGVYTLQTNLDNVFLANSGEAIWQLAPVSPGFNTYEGNNFIATSTPRTQTVSNEWLASIEAGDARGTQWVGSSTDGINTYYFPYKYKVVRGAATVTEFYTVFRLAEQYLIRAEARAQQNMASSAIGDMDIIRARAGLASWSDANPTPTTADILAAIQHERRVELFAEWGHRWFDLKRTGKADEVMAPLRAQWQATDVLFPIPQSERNSNPNLTQNEGY